MAAAVLHRVIARSCQSSDVAIRFPHCSAVSSFHRAFGGAPHQRPLCVKGAGLASARSGGLFPSGWASMRLPTRNCWTLGHGVIGFCTAYPPALHQSLRCPCGRHLPLHKGGFGAVELHWFGGRLRMRCRTPQSPMATAPLTGEPEEKKK